MANSQDLLTLPRWMVFGQSASLICIKCLMTSAAKKKKKKNSQTDFKFQFHISYSCAFLITSWQYKYFLSKNLPLFFCMWFIYKH